MPFLPNEQNGVVVPLRTVRIVDDAALVVAAGERTGVEGNVQWSLLHERSHDRLIVELLRFRVVAVAVLAAQTVAGNGLAHGRLALVLLRHVGSILLANDADVFQVLVGDVGVAAVTSATSSPLHSDVLLRAVHQALLAPVNVRILRGFFPRVN